MKLPKRYITALDRACAMAKEGERDVEVFDQDGITINVNSSGGVQILLVEHDQELYDALRAAARARSRNHSVGGVQSMFDPWEISFSEPI
jgi:hypothetical protein